ncbi:apolipoprotein N-acyltransferase [Thermosipho atlanticus]|uniref:Apolipoprotein N-acyltransferase n=1 Tax=Thermosipho atlanticus DSM 15807 TaxID=1123380 RepID=A0A1M5SJS3_9BACT|nr:apolipoprotein N-acyltransferase [Thermosipho atlanticus]SHH38804.1 apolipoprotein N-acyltransferase [Thermosipho atlanticus DSM 15807]
MIFVFLSSILTALSMPGFFWGGLVWFSLIPLFSGLEKKSYWLKVLYIFLFFYTFFFISLYWVIPVLTKNLPEFFGRFNSIVGFGAFLLLCLLETLPFLLFAVLYAYFIPRIKNNIPKALFVASIYSISDFIRGIGDLGFTGGRLSDALFKDIGIIQSVAFIGTIGLTFLIVLVNYLLYLNFKNLNKFVPIMFLTISSIYLINNFILNVLPTNKANIPIVAVQTNYDQHVKYSITNQKILEDIEQILKSTPNYLHVFPEATFPTSDIRNTNINEFFKNISYKKPIIIGFPTYDDDGKIYNSAVVYSNGKYIGKYDKIRLFPFVEFLPYEKIFKTFSFLKGVSYFNEGKSFKIFEINNFPHTGIQICFESYFGEISRNLTNQGAEILFVITNDGWYKYNTALWQHFSKSIFRAVENRRYVVQVSNKGITGVVDYFGRINQIIPLRSENYAIFNIKAENKTTIYSKYGDWFIYIALICSFIIPIVYRNKPSKKFF